MIAIMCTSVVFSSMMLIRWYISALIPTEMPLLLHLNHHHQTMIIIIDFFLSFANIGSIFFRCLTENGINNSPYDVSFHKDYSIRLQYLDTYLAFNANERLVFFYAAYREQH